MDARVDLPATEKVKISVRDLNFYYGKYHALKHINLSIAANKVTAFIGPSGCGKSTLLRTFNRMNDLVDGCRVEGEINLYGNNIYRKGEDVADVMMTMGEGDISVLCEMSYASRVEHDRFPETYVVVEAEDGSAELGPDFWLRVTSAAAGAVIPGVASTCCRSSERGGPPRRRAHHPAPEKRTAASPGHVRARRLLRRNAAVPRRQPPLGLGEGQDGV